MKINYVTTPENSLYHDTLSLTGISDTSQYPIVQFIRNANSWYRKAASWIRSASGTWEYDDSNWTTLPEATTPLRDGQQDYSLDTKVQEIERVEVLDASGNYHQLKQIDQSQLVGIALDEFMETNGMPRYYDVRGFSLYLYPAPDDGYVSTTDGLKLLFSREISGFTATSTDREPGFNSDYHRILSLGAAYDYCLSNGIEDRKKGIRDEIEIYKNELMSQSSR